MSAQEPADGVLAKGYVTQNKCFVEVVWVMLGKMDNVQNVPGKGYRLKRATAGSKGLLAWMCGWAGRGSAIHARRQPPAPTGFCAGSRHHHCLSCRHPDQRNLGGFHAR